MPDICLHTIISILLRPRFCTAVRPTYVDLRILKALLQIVIDRLIRDLADQGEIRHSNLLLLGTLEHRLLNLGLPPAAAA